MKEAWTLEVILTINLKWSQITCLRPRLHEYVFIENDIVFILTIIVFDRFPVDENKEKSVVLLKTI